MKKEVEQHSLEICLPNDIDDLKDLKLSKLTAKQVKTEGIWPFKKGVYKLQIDIERLNLEKDIQLPSKIIEIPGTVKAKNATRAVWRNLVKVHDYYDKYYGKKS